jgi:hypothetical protein
VYVDFEPLAHLLNRLDRPFTTTEVLEVVDRFYNLEKVVRDCIKAFHQELLNKYFTCYG